MIKSAWAINLENAIEKQKSCIAVWWKWTFKNFFFQPHSKEKEKQFNNIWNKLCIHVCFFPLLPLIPSCCIWKDLARSSSNSLQYSNINCCLPANIASQIIKTKLNSFLYWYICMLFYTLRCCWGKDIAPEYV